MKKIMVLIAAGILALAACGNDEEALQDFYNEFQETVSIEEDIEDITNDFNDLEAERTEMQQSLSAADLDELAALSSDLVDNTDERMDLLEEEASVMAESREAAEASSGAIDDISDEEYANEAQSLIDRANDRYDAHEELMTQFTSTLEKEREVFEYLGTGDVSQSEIDEEINDLGEEYDTLNTLQEDYSEKTQNVNEVKSGIRDTISDD